MKKIPLLSALAIGALVCPALVAQSRPADATGLCKDGTYSTEVSKHDACHGHHGVKKWYGPASPSPAATSNAATSDSAAPNPAPPTTAVAPSPTTQARTQSLAAAQRAGQSGEPLETQSIKKGPAANIANATPPSGETPGLVWYIAASHIYHCPGTKYYGKTRHGAYISEDEAKSKGAHIARGEVCNK